MKTTLISYTEDAQELLIFSKKTRLKMSAESFQEIKEMPRSEKLKELDYVFGTIGSSWEFVDYVFMIEGVTRAFTHQLVRHRVGVAFAQQAQRVVDMSDFDFLETGSAVGDIDYRSCMVSIKNHYERLIEKGVHPQDARGILPTNVKTNILMKINLRSLSGLMNVRLCFKAQGEFQNVARSLRADVAEVHPWAERILQVSCVQHGGCAFPNFKECPIKKAGLLKPHSSEAMKDLWESTHMEVQPTGEGTKK